MLRRPTVLRLLAVAVVAVAAVFVVMRPPEPPPLTFPGGKAFAFTIVDDTDMATLARLKPIYGVLERYGLRTTRTTWVYETNDPANPANRGDSLQNPEYRAFLLDLQAKGFEIALHGVRGGNSPRADIVRGLDEYRDVLGAYPTIQINHSLNRDNLYWGPHLYTIAPMRWAARLAIRQPFDGHDPSSPNYWGDLARQHVKYVRRFTYSEINLRRVVPDMPYHLDDMPDVRYWFATSNGDRVVEFEALLSDENIARLEREHGVCLVYAHLGAGSFSTPEGVNPRFEARIRAIAARNGWFVPASTILDFLASQPSWSGGMSFKERLRLDAKFVAQRLGL